MSCRAWRRLDLMSLLLPLLLLLLAIFRAKVVVVLCCKNSREFFSHLLLDQDDWREQRQQKGRFCFLTNTHTADFVEEKQNQTEGNSPGELPGERVKLLSLLLLDLIWLWPRNWSTNCLTWPWLALPGCESKVGRRPARRRQTRDMRDNRKLRHSRALRTLPVGYARVPFEFKCLPGRRRRRRSGWNVSVCCVDILSSNWLDLG